VTAAFATSRYNFRLPLSEGFALFNASTGGVMKLDGRHSAELSELLAGPRTLVSEDELGEELTSRLRRTGFLVHPDADEVEPVRDRYWTARGRAPVVLVVTTTMDCNLGCYYCYESRSGDAIGADSADELARIAAERLDRQGKRSLHVNWFGGEPLLNLEAIERGSAAMQAYCAEAGVSYHASVLSNGTRWPEDVGAFVARHKLRQIQISFDGLEANHDRRRHYRRTHRPDDAGSPFQLAVHLVDRLLEHARVDLRFNADPGNAEDLPGFIELARERGWFDAPHRCVLSVAKLTVYSARSSFMSRRELDDESYEALCQLVRDEVPARSQYEQEVVEGFPFPRTSVCGALAPDSAVVGADGLEYRCGLQVGEKHRAVGRVFGAEEGEEFDHGKWWDTYDPTTLPTCSRCSFLPMCWSGCPKMHLDATTGEDVPKPNLGKHWRGALPRLIAAGFGETAPPDFAYTEADQFREGQPEP
jgi:uncharacterized protein